MAYQSHRQGLTLVGTLVALTIFSLLIVAAVPVTLRVFSGSEELRSQGQMRQRSLLFMRKFIKELRTAQQSHDGSYPLALADPNEVIFYSDYQDDGLIERIRYFLDGTTLKRGEVVPAGDPLVYNLGDEVIQDELMGVYPDGDAVFTYYDSSYTGATSSDPLSAPFNIADVRMVKFNLLLKPDDPQTRFYAFSSQVMIRNLKDN